MEIRPIESILIGDRYRKDMGNIRGLAQSIKDVGLLHPIVVTPEGKLIAGARRLAACKALGWTEVPVREVNLRDVLRGEHDENVARKDFLPSEAVAIAKALLPVEKEAATERRQATQLAGRSEDGAPIIGAGKFPAPIDKGQARDKVASYVGVSGRTLEKATKIVEAAEKEPERFAPLVEQMDRTGKVDGVFKRLKVLEQAQEIQQEPPPLPTGPFRVIVADPPWAYEKRVEDATHRANLPYPSMTIEEIKALPVQGLSHDDAVLWLWTTNAHMREAFDVLEVWGFQHKTILTWVKDRMGTGDWLRGQTEHCLLAVRGKPVVTLTNQTTVIHGPLREHSRKPEEFYALVETLCPGSKVELFARTQREGWANFGNEPDKFRAEGSRSA